MQGGYVNACRLVFTNESRLTIQIMEERKIILTLQVRT
jgi:hypothetical protein